MVISNIFVYRYDKIMNSFTPSKYRMYRVTPFVYGKSTRFIFQNFETMEPSVAVSIYEPYLTHKKNSGNSVKDELTKLASIFTWGYQEQVNIDEFLLNGLAPSPSQVRHFCHWLYELVDDQVIGLNTYNKTLDFTATMFCWFISQYGTFHGSGNIHHENRALVINEIRDLFRIEKKRSRKLQVAEDLSEEDIAAIEKFLKPANRQDVSIEVANRDYLIWRLAIEFGMREGEIRALRLEDCPHRQQDYFKIVRIEERGPDYFDPRGVSAPRPKTLSRDLGYVLDNSPIPKLLGNYISTYRYRTVKRNGKVVREPILDHHFLVVNYFRKSGSPLCSSGIQKLAQTISMSTGVRFHWHLARHAFFNRAYSAIVGHKDLSGRLMDLVYWGGWSSDNSLQIYVNRAKREHARTALAFWQTGNNKWDALL
jgi:integrase